SIAKTIEQACAIARYTEEDPCTGLADAERMAKEFPDLDLWHPWALSPQAAIELGIGVEEAGRAVSGISNSESRSAQACRSLSVYANSHGCVGRERGTRHTLSCALIAEDAAGMQRDYWYESVRAASDLPDAASIGRKAAERTLARLASRQLTTRE